MDKWPFRDVPDWFVELFREASDSVEGGYKPAAEKLWVDIHERIFPGRIIPGLKDGMVGPPECGKHGRTYMRCLRDSDYICSRCEEEGVNATFKASLPAW